MRIQKPAAAGRRLCFGQCGATVFAKFIDMDMAGDTATDRDERKNLSEVEHGSWWENKAYSSSIA